MAPFSAWADSLSSVSLLPAQVDYQDSLLRAGAGDDNPFFHRRNQPPGLRVQLLAV
jgi:hypothetical protein